eukprot:XP_002938932.2 PREDICTED: uncharacterized threonine-rich GPI-anchored glycoprotein PJ4664.02-like [Xenopus tropicalis]
MQHPRLAILVLLLIGIGWVRCETTNSTDSTVATTTSPITSSGTTAPSSTSTNSTVSSNTGTQTNTASDNTTSTVSPNTGTQTNTVSNNTTSTVSPNTGTQTNTASVNTTSTVSPNTGTQTNTASNNTTSTVSPNTGTQTNTASNNTTSTVSPNTGTQTNTASVNTTSTVSPNTGTQTNTASVNTTSTVSPNTGTQTNTASNNTASTVPSSTAVIGTAVSSSTILTTLAPTISLNLQFKLTNLEFNDSLTNRSSDYYKTLKDNMEQQLRAVYIAKFTNFKSVNVAGFQKGSVIVVSSVTFENSTQSSTSVTNDNIVRALVNSIQSNGSLGDYKMDSTSIQSDSSNVTNLSPQNIVISFLIKTPYNMSATDSLKNPIINWVNNSFLNLPNVTAVSLNNNSLSFSNANNWTLCTATFAVITPNIFNATQALDIVLNFRGNVTFSIVPSSLSIQGNTKSFNIISPKLGIQNVPYTQSLSDKTSIAFQANAAAIENSFRAIFQSQQLVEPVVTSFSNDSRGLLPSVDLYFLSGITSQDVSQQILNNLAQFSQRNIILIPSVTNPIVPISFTFNLQQAYTTDLTTNNMNTTIVNLVTPILNSLYSNNVVNSPIAVISNNSGAATVIANYTINTTSLINFVSIDSSAVQNALLQNQTFTDIVRISSLSVNGASNKLQGYLYKLRFTSLTFNSNLSYPSTDDYQKMKKNIVQAMSSILKAVGSQQVAILSFVSGSVIANTEVTVTAGGSTSDQVTTAIVNNMDSLKSAGLTLDPQSVVTPTPSVAASTVASPPTISSFPGYAVAIIVMCGLAILALPFLILLFLKTSICSKVSKACSLKPPYGEYQGMVIPNKGAGVKNYKTHSYEVAH